jgi:hypothetical protein
VKDQHVLELQNRGKSHSAVSFLVGVPRNKVVAVLVRREIGHKDFEVAVPSFHG